MSLSDEIPEICIELNDQQTDVEEILNKKISKDCLTDYEDMSDSGPNDSSNDENICQDLKNFTINSNNCLRPNDSLDDDCHTDIESYLKSDDEDDNNISDYYSDTDILQNDYFDNFVSEDIVKKSDENEFDEEYDDVKRKKVEFYAKKREKRAKRDAEKLFRKLECDKPNENVESENEDNGEIFSCFNNYELTDIESLENSESEYDDNDDNYEIPLPEPVREKIIISDNTEGFPITNIEPIEMENIITKELSDNDEDDDENDSDSIMDVLSVDILSDCDESVLNYDNECTDCIVVKDFNEVIQF